MTKQLITVIVSAILILPLGMLGCSDKSVYLERAEWVLESYGTVGQTQTTLPDTEITLAFDDEENGISGTAGCNDYFAEYDISDRFISIGRLGSTRMYCQDPRGTMEQELEYLEILQKSESYIIQDNELIILSSGSQILEFNPR
jgi:heat shock protein HslJ